MVRMRARSRVKEEEKEGCVMTDKGFSARLGTCARHLRGVCTQGGALVGSLMRLLLFYNRTADCLDRLAPRGDVPSISTLLRTSVGPLQRLQSLESCLVHHHPLTLFSSILSHCRCLYSCSGIGCIISFIPYPLPSFHPSLPLPHTLSYKMLRALASADCCQKLESNQHCTAQSCRSVNLH
jgi:hypothetical protein